MTLDEQIAALPPPPDLRNVHSHMEALVMDAKWHAARLDLTRRALQEMVEIVEASPRTQVVADACANARRVLEVTAP